MTTPEHIELGSLEPRRNRYGHYLVRRAGEVEDRAYRRVTTLAKAIDDTTALTDWKQRQTAKGIAMRPDLAAAAAALDPDEDKGKFRDIVEEAHVAAGASARSHLGTALHRFTEVVDRGERPAGVPADLVPDLDAYVRTMAAAGLTPVAIEPVLINDRFNVAGMCDRAWRLPNGLIVPGDLKTGSSLEYNWCYISVQLALYATHNATYDYRTEQEYGPVEMDQQRGLIVHLPVGEAHCYLYWVDLEQGIRNAQVAMDVEAARASARGRNQSLYTVTNALEIAAMVDEAPPEGAPVAPEPVAELEAERKVVLAARVRALAPAALSDMAQWWPAGVPVLKNADHHHTTEQLDAIEGLLRQVEDHHQQPFHMDSVRVAMGNVLRRHVEQNPCPECTGDGHHCEDCGQLVPHGLKLHPLCHDARQAAKQLELDAQPAPVVNADGHDAQFVHAPTAPPSGPVCGMCETPLSSSDAVCPVCVPEEPATGCHHADRWQQWTEVGHCVYCPCGHRLYRGTLPKTAEAARSLGALQAVFGAITEVAATEGAPPEFVCDSCARRRPLDDLVLVQRPMVDDDGVGHVDEVGMCSVCAAATEHAWTGKDTGHPAVVAEREQLAAEQRTEVTERIMARMAALPDDIRAVVNGWAVANGVKNVRTEYPDAATQAKISGALAAAELEHRDRLDLMDGAVRTHCAGNEAMAADIRAELGCHRQTATHAQANALVLAIECATTLDLHPTTEGYALRPEVAKELRSRLSRAAEIVDAGKAWANALGRPAPRTQADVVADWVVGSCVLGNARRPAGRQAHHTLVTPEGWPNHNNGTGDQCPTDEEGF